MRRPLRSLPSFRAPFAAVPGHFVLTSLAACAFATVGPSTALAAQAAVPPSFPEAPTPEVVHEVRQAIAAMKENERGPYLRIRWYCNDGTVHAPGAAVCRERGGGNQHAEVSPLTLRLRELGYSVGTIFQALDWETFADSARAGYRLRELVMEKHLVDVDDGWVMRRARYYRGARQIEDEEARGRELLIRRFATPGWVERNYLLALQLTRAVPHTSVGGSGTVNRIRSLATEIADLDAGFMRARVKIHSVPSRDDIATVESYLARGSHPEGVRTRLTELRDLLRRQYDPAAALASLDAYARALGAPWNTELPALAMRLAANDPDATLTALAEIAPRIRDAAAAATDGRRVLTLLDLQRDLQDRAFVAATGQSAVRLPDRRAALGRYAVQVDLAYAAGFLSGREREAAHGELDRLVAAGTLPAIEYKTSLGYLGRALDWSRGTVRGVFAPVITRYAPLDPRAEGLVDDLLRGSVLLAMSRTLDDLQTDADLALESSSIVLGTSIASGVRGLNPGAALRTLRIRHDEAEEVDAETIYVLPETPAELKPVAGVLTLDEGNLLSHVQLLARNLGIPNASMRPEMLEILERADGRDVLYAVTPLGRVLVRWPDELTADERALVPSAQPEIVDRVELDASRLDLTRWRRIPREELRSSLSGIVVGPKAANLGQLAADFPGRVSGASALPFGMFVRHADRRWNGSDGTVLEELRAAGEEVGRLRAAGATEAEVNAYMLPRLAWAREAIEALPWIPELRDEVVAAALETTDGDITKGLFVRSDTNVEDLPQFSGAGLNITVANRTSIEDVLAAVKRVWTSPFTERSYLWRSRILSERAEAFPSVLLQESVPSQKSGVMITSGLQEGGPDDLTIVTAEGVGGGVDGEDSETIVVAPDGGVRLLSQAKSPRRRHLIPGGTRWVASQRPDTLLHPAELDQLRTVVDEWKATLAGTPEEDFAWDFEFGFVDGRLWLFQVRPFVRLRNSDLLDKLSVLDAPVLANGDRPVALDAPVLRPESEARIP